MVSRENEAKTFAAVNTPFAVGCENIATQSLAIFERLGGVAARVIGVDERKGIVWLRMARSVAREGAGLLTVW